MRSWLVALRIARREARRAKGRTALTVTMIALPVLCLTFAVATYNMYDLTPAERVTRMIGAADATVRWLGESTPPGDTSGDTSGVTAPTSADLLAGLPPGSRVAPFWRDVVSMDTAAGIGDMNSYGIDTADPMTSGMVRVLTGRTPTADNEVAVSPDALARLGTRIGGHVTTASSDPRNINYPEHTYTVVGTVEVGGSLFQDLLFRPSQRPTYQTWLVALSSPITSEQTSRLGALGFEATSRESLLHAPTQEQADQQIQGLSIFGIGTLIVGLGLLEVVLLAGPAFAVGARRRERDLALVATIGGTPAVLRRIVLADGVISGIIAAITGAGLGVAAAFAGRPFLEEYLVHQRFGGYRVAPVAVLVVATLAVLTGVLGALVPAFTAGRQDVVAALSGRRGAVRSRAVWLLLGLAGVGTGAFIAVAGAMRHSSSIVLTGLVTGELGLVLCTPTLVGLAARLGRFLPVAPRIALRDTARRRAAAAPAISAVMAAVAGSVALTVYLGANSARMPAYPAGLPTGSISIATHGDTSSRIRQVATIDVAIAQVLPTAKAVTITSYACDDSCQIRPAMPVARRCPYSPDNPLSKADQLRARADPRCSDGWAAGTLVNNFLPSAVTSDPSVVAAVLGISGAPLEDATAELRAGGVIVNDRRYVTNGMVTLDLERFGDTGLVTLRTATVPAYLVTGTKLAVTTVLSPAALAKLDMHAETSGVLVTPSHPPTQKERDALNAALIAARLDGAYIEDGPISKDSVIGWILAIAAGVIALGAAGIATGLAAADGRNDLSTLAAVGATPRVRRVLSLSQSGVIAGLGSLLGAVAGFGAAAAVLTGLNQVYAKNWPAPAPYPIDVPWLNLGVSLIAVPVIAMLGAGLLTRSRLPSERRAY